MTRALSYKFRFFTFVCIALLSYVHGYNLNETYLQPYTTINEPLTVTAFIEYLFANGLLRFRIPILFLISGYLYAQYDNRPYLQQVKRRFVSLIVPYLLWSAFALGLIFLLQQFDYTYTLVQAMKIDQMGDNRPYLQIGWWGMLQRWLLAPVAFQLWFIAGLFIYNLCYPFLRWAVVRMPKLWLLLCCLVFLAGFRFFWLEGQGLFFFSMGIWLQQKNIPIEKRPRWLSIGVAFILFVGLCIIKTFMAFECPPDESTTHIAMLLIYQAAVLCGVVTIWFGADGVVNWCMRQRWFQYASGFSFFIYGLHVPLLTCVMHLFMLELHFVPLYRLLGYLFLPMLVVALCIGLGALLRHYAPYVYKLLTGGRGF